MKRLYIFALFCLLFVMAASAQEYFPEGTSWTWGMILWGQPQGDILRWEVRGEKEIAGRIYHAVDCYQKDENGNWALATTTGRGFALREDGGLVWAYFDAIDDEILYYDFNWEEGKAVFYLDWNDDAGERRPNVVLRDVEYRVLNDGKEYACFTAYQNYLCVNSIGMVEGYGGLFAAYRAEPDNGAHYIMTSFVRNGVEIYVNHEADVNGIEAVSEGVSNQDPQFPGLFDLQGRRLTEKPAKGMYIQNGKKVVK